MLVTSPLYVALSALLVIALAVQVILLRRRKRIGLGDGGDTRLACAIRAHANALENLPLALLLLVLFELGGARPMAIHAYGATLLLARLWHCVGLSGSPGTSAGRLYGTALTWLVVIGLSAQVLLRAI
ncbi:MAG: glutathione S-transferase [Lysobacterales bacterium CG17_big_fil_post_rev_8_21_14_2_50_64_11]|nr:MAG: glutathione S-transferase [Xanthomonadales bacterium CG17_big_fil_post_rev_8_21_14_2_50_64_11]PIX61278.1 MAG: glutathione S-transferase [Xanthomonadales bacterium CG_4_10_14_3_um_filter_64_11]